MKIFLTFSSFTRLFESFFESASLHSICSAVRTSLPQILSVLFSTLCASLLCRYVMKPKPRDWSAFNRAYE